MRGALCVFSRLGRGGVGAAPTCGCRIDAAHRSARLAHHESGPSRGHGRHRSCSSSSLSNWRTSTPACSRSPASRIASPPPRT
eukprot:4047545-Prymnesium_polylepis.1